MKAWVKLHTEILDDRKMSQLTDRQYRVFVNLLALGGIIDKDGLLMSTEDLAYRLRVTEAAITQDLHVLANLNTVVNNDGVWFLVHWTERQPTMPSETPEATRERKRQQRERERKEKEESQRDADVTTSHDVTESVTAVTTIEESRVDKKREDEDEIDTPTQTTPVNGTGDFPRRDRRLDPDYGEVCTKYEQNIGLLTPLIAQKLSDFMEQYPAFWVTSATDVATQAEKRNLLYIGGILKTWRREGKGPIPTNGTGHDVEPTQRPALPDSPPGGE